MIIDGGRDIDLSGNEPGFTLPTNIGELGDDARNLDLSWCSLHAELPLAIGKFKANNCRVDLSGNQGFVLSSDVSAVLNVTALDFSSCHLEGASLILSHL